MSDNIINSDQSLELHIKQLRGLYSEHKYLRVSIKTGKQRTDTQNRSMHKYFNLLSIQLAAGGFDFRQTLKQDIDVQWSEYLIKEYMWRPVQEAVTGHSSTTKPTISEYSEIYDALNNHLSNKFGIYCPWPSKD